MSSNTQGSPDRFELPQLEQPLSLLMSEIAAPPAFGPARCMRFEFSSRGDRVPGRLILPDAQESSAPRPAPLVLFQHGAGGSKESDYLDAAAPWVRAGLAVATIDFPLHGERRSSKLSDRLLATVRSGVAAEAGSQLDAGSEQLWVAFAQQALCDLKHCLDAMTPLPEIDDERVAYASFSLGSMLGAAFCALDPRPRAAALALGGGGFGPSKVDPASYIADIAPRPLLMVNAAQDELVSQAAAKHLFAAAAEPKAIEWFEAPHSALPGVALKAMWVFLREHLEIDAM